MTLIILYSLYIDIYILGDADKIKLMRKDDLVGQFERLLLLLSKRNPRQTIYKYYQVQQKIDLLTTEYEIYLLKKISERPGYEYPLPTYLYARSSFLNEE